MCDKIFIVGQLYWKESRGELSDYRSLKEISSFKNLNKLLYVKMKNEWKGSYSS